MPPRPRRAGAAQGEAGARWRDRGAARDNLWARERMVGGRAQGGTPRTPTPFRQAPSPRLLPPATTGRPPATASTVCRRAARARSTSPAGAGWRGDRRPKRSRRPTHGRPPPPRRVHAPGGRCCCRLLRAVPRRPVDPRPPRDARPAPRARARPRRAPRARRLHPSAAGVPRHDGRRRAGGPGGRRRRRALPRVRRPLHGLRPPLCRGLPSRPRHPRA